MWSSSGCGDVCGGFGAIGHPWSGMLLFVRSVRFLWRGSLGSGVGAAEAGIGYVSYGDWPCGMRCTFGGCGVYG